MTYRALIESEDNGVNSIGRFMFYRGDHLVFQCYALELSFRDNARGKSCVPAGRYLVRRWQSRRFGNVWRLYDEDGTEIDGRSGILIHPANYASSEPDYPTELRGCIALGFETKDLNGDGVMDLAQSRKAHAAFELAASGCGWFYLTIRRRNASETPSAPKSQNKPESKSETKPESKPESKSEARSEGKNERGS